MVVDKAYDGGPGTAAAKPQPADPLALIVDRQRRENAQMRTALRTRAVIEQAKGILVARSGTDPETAFQRLVQHSQQTNRRLAQIAAEVVAATVRTPFSVEGSDDEDPLTTTGGVTPEAFLTAAAVIAAPDLGELLEAVVQFGQQFDVAAGTLALAEPDGALRIVGQYGYETHAISGWRRIPPGSQLPIGAAAEARQTIWLGDRGARQQRFPTAERFPAQREACAAIPVELDRQLVGVLVLDWDQPQDFPDGMRRSLESVAELCAGPIAELLRGYDEPLPGMDFEPGWSSWFWGFLDGQPIAHVTLEPIIEHEAIVDLRVVHANPAAEAATGLSGGVSLLEHFPTLSDMQLVIDASKVLVTGVPHREPSITVPAIKGPARLRIDDLCINRVGTLVVASWASWQQL